MSELSSKECSNCLWAEPYADELRCFAPAVNRTFPEGVPCTGATGARGCGRFCGPAGIFFAPKRRTP